mgnify:CR=1 FL=1
MQGTVNDTWAAITTPAVIEDPLRPGFYRFAFKPIRGGARQVPPSDLEKIQIALTSLIAVGVGHTVACHRLNVPFEYYQEWLRLDTNFQTMLVNACQEYDSRMVDDAEEAIRNILANGKEESQLKAATFILSAPKSKQRGWGKDPDVVQTSVPSVQILNFFNDVEMEVAQDVTPRGVSANPPPVIQCVEEPGSGEKKLVIKGERVSDEEEDGEWEYVLDEDYSFIPPHAGRYDEDNCKRRQKRRREQSRSRINVGINNRQTKLEQYV